MSSNDAYANLLLSASLRERGLRGQDAALATELVYGTLRSRSCYDAVISMCADRDLDQIDPPVLAVLRLGTHQLLDLAGHLSTRYSHPRWIVEALAAALGESAPGIPQTAPGDALTAPGQTQAEAGLAQPKPGLPQAGRGLPRTEAALAADQDRPAVTLAAVPGLASRDELVTTGAEAARWSPFGAYLDHGDPGAISAVAERRAAVQDEASQLAVLALTRAAAEGRDRFWLDLCAGPGGKARLLAGIAAERGASLVAAPQAQARGTVAAGSGRHRRARRAAAGAA